MNLVLDTGVLGKLCHPKSPRNRHVASWFRDLLEQNGQDHQVFVPEIADYELRRKLLHLIKRGQASDISLQRLDELIDSLSFITLSTKVMRRAAELWAEARAAGLPTASPSSLDGDVILAAQAESVGGVVVTENLKHLSRFVAVRDWRHVEHARPKTLPYEEGQLPPRGYMRVQDESGHPFWVDPSTVDLRGDPKSELSDEQVDRIRRIWTTFSDVLPGTFEEDLEGFRQEPEPEREIRVWEFLAAVYERELASREITGVRDKILVFKVLMTASEVNTFDELLALLPDAKSLPNARRIFDQVHVARRPNT